MRWKAILGESERYCEQAKHESRSPIAIFYKTPNQKFGPRTKERLGEASFVRLLELSEEKTAEVFAAHDLYADVLQGDLRHLTADDVLDSLQRFFLSWVAQIRGSIEENDPPVVTDPVQPQLRDLVAELRLVNIDVVMERLNTDRDTVLKEVKHIQEIAVFASPKTTVFQWTQSR